MPPADTLTPKPTNPNLPHTPAPNPHPSLPKSFARYEIRFILFGITSYCIQSQNPGLRVLYTYCWKEFCLTDATIKIILKSICCGRLNTKALRQRELGYLRRLSKYLETDWQMHYRADSSNRPSQPGIKHPYFYSGLQCELPLVIRAQPGPSVHGIE